MTDEELRDLVVQTAQQCSQNSIAIAELRLALAEEKEERQAGEDLLTLDVDSLRADMQGLRGDIIGLRGDLSGLRTELSRLVAHVLRDGD